MNFEIVYFVNNKGRAPVQDFILELPELDRAKVHAYLKYLSDAGYKMRRPFADSLGGKTGLYELRPGRSSPDFSSIDVNRRETRFAPNGLGAKFLTLHRGSVRKTSPVM